MKITKHKIHKTMTNNQRLICTMLINDHKHSETAKNLQHWCQWSCRSGSAYHQGHSPVAMTIQCNVIHMVIAHSYTQQYMCLKYIRCKTDHSNWSIQCHYGITLYRIIHTKHIGCYRTTIGSSGTRVRVGTIVYIFKWVRKCATVHSW